MTVTPQIDKNTMTDLIIKLNDDSNTTGIMVQLPFPKSFSFNVY